MTQPTRTIVSKPRLLFRPNPVLGWSLTPGHGVKVAFRPEVIQTIGADGWRHVPGRTEGTGPKLAVYGCSFTYGTGLADGETYVARLQAALPQVQLRNRGIGGQSTVQSYLQFRRDIRDGKVDAAIFGVFSDHRFRNVPHPHRMQQFLSPEWYRLGVEHVPVLRQRRKGRHAIIYVPIWQPALQTGGFNAFLPDPVMLDGATLTMLEEIEALAASRNIPIRVALLDKQDPAFNALVLERFSVAIDISVPLDREHTFRPLDPHPNVRANEIFAERLLPAAQQLIATATGGSE
ncbi:SGNH/GDSL hydrolase family protein [Vannielia litorea]|uniref:SGNH/GDSL hydrolase family protein n=1 Tax=Vannielia litorea TaxID=1217970 RepID=UPI001BD0BB36|nr:hypothetical protein [Vannielia litorea]